MCNYVRYKLTLVLLCFSPPSPGSVSTPPPCDIVENPIEILDAAYLENAVCTANSLVEDNVNWWMKTCSGYITITNNIKVSCLYIMQENYTTLYVICWKTCQMSAAHPLCRNCLCTYHFQSRSARNKRSRLHQLMYIGNWSQPTSIMPLSGK